jgi:type VI secretion system protein ImpA
MILEAYLAPRGDDAPSGENLEYDAAFTALQLAAQPGEERQVGKEIVAGEEPDYRLVEEKALEVLERSHDLRAAVLLSLARLKRNGIEGFSEVTGYVRHCLETYWDTCHPQLDADDDNDPTMRITAVMGLSSMDGVLRALRSTALSESPNFGRVTLRDIEIADGEISLPSDMSKAPDQSSIQAAFRDTKPEILAARLTAARSALADAQAISAVFDQRTPGDGPDLAPLIKMLKKAVSKLAAAVGEPENPLEETTDAAMTETAQVVTGGGTGAITSARDVQAALDRIIGYYQAHEPSSPLPILLQRARRLVGADFMTILNDIAPAGLETARMIGGIAEEE